MSEVGVAGRSGVGIAMQSSPEQGGGARDRERGDERDEQPLVLGPSFEQCAHGEPRDEPGGQDGDERGPQLRGQRVERKVGELEQVAGAGADLLGAPRCPERRRSDGERCRQHEERSEEHTSELQSRGHLVCRLLLEKKKKIWCQDAKSYTMKDRLLSFLFLSYRLILSLIHAKSI